MLFNFSCFFRSFVFVYCVIRCNVASLCVQWTKLRYDFVLVAMICAGGCIQLCWTVLYRINLFWITPSCCLQCYVFAVCTCSCAHTRVKHTHTHTHTRTSTDTDTPSRKMTSVGIRLNPHIRVIGTLHLLDRQIIYHNVCISASKCMHWITSSLFLLTVCDSTAVFLSCSN